MKKKIIIVTILNLLLYLNCATAQPIKIKYRERNEFRNDTLIYERIEKKSKRVIFSEYYKNNEPISTWKRYTAQNDSIIGLDYNFELLYIDKIPDNLLLIDLSDSVNIENVIHPKYELGNDVLFETIKNNLTYPLFARRLGYHGSVKVLFKIQKDGSAYPLGVVKSVVPELDKEAIRVLREFKKWHPATINGFATESHVIFPVNFKLSDY